MLMSNQDMLRAAKRLHHELGDHELAAKLQHSAYALGPMLGELEGYRARGKQDRYIAGAMRQAVELVRQDRAKTMRNSEQLRTLKGIAVGLGEAYRIIAAQECLEEAKRALLRHGGEAKTRAEQLAVKVRMHAMDGELCDTAEYLDAIVTAIHCAVKQALQEYRSVAPGEHPPSDASPPTTGCSSNSQALLGQIYAAAAQIKQRTWASSPGEGSLAGLGQAANGER